MLRTRLTAIAATIAGFLISRPVFAQGTPGGSTAADFFNPPKNSGLPQVSAIDLILNILTVFLQATGAVAVILIIWGGYQILTSAGNEQKIDSGKRVLIWAVIGTIIIFSSLGIVLFIDRTI